MASKATKEEIFLDDPDKFYLWNKDLQTRAVAVMLWDLMNPENDDYPFETKPKQPNMKDYEKRQVTIGVSTRSQSTDNTMQLEEADPNRQPNSSGEMTASGRANYNADWNVFIF